MLNYEKNKDEIENYDETQKALDCYLCNLRKGNCDDVNDNCNKCLKESLKFLFSEYKEPIKLTQFEFDFFKNIDPEFEWIARDEDGCLYIYNKKPYKCCVEWENKSLCYNISAFIHLFQFINWEDEEPYNIQDILKNCEIIGEDDMKCQDKKI